MALCSGHVTLLFSRCLSSSPVIEVNEVTENIPNFELQNHRLCALNRILFLKGNVSELPGGKCTGSEHKFQSQLHRSRSADLIERVEAAVCATRPQTVRQRLCRLTK
jgi:hypothetical protein